MFPKRFIDRFVFPNIFDNNFTIIISKPNQLSSSHETDRGDQAGPVAEPDDLGIIVGGPDVGGFPDPRCDQVVAGPIEKVDVEIVLQPRQAEDLVGPVGNLAALGGRGRDVRGLREVQLLGVQVGLELEQLPLLLVGGVLVALAGAAQRVAQDALLEQVGVLVLVLGLEGQRAALAAPELVGRHPLRDEPVRVQLQVAPLAHLGALDLHY